MAWRNDRRGETMESTKSINELTNNRNMQHTNVKRGWTHNINITNALNAFENKCYWTILRV